MEKTTIYQRNHYYHQVCYVERNNQTVSYTNQWSSTSVESTMVYKHSAEATSYNQNYTSAVFASYNQSYTSAAKTSAVFANYNKNYNTSTTKTSAVPAKHKLYNGSAEKTPVAAETGDNSNSTEQEPESAERNQVKKSTCEQLIDKFFAGEDIGVNSLERWLAGL